MNARHVVKLFLNLLSIHFGLCFALFIALYPRSKPHLYDRYPDYVAAVIYIAVKLVNLVKHFLVIFLSHPHVFLDHLNLFLTSLDLNIIYLIIEFALFIFFKLDHLGFSHLLLNFIDHFHVEFTLKVLFTEHGNDVLKVILLEPVVSWHLQM